MTGDTVHHHLSLAENGNYHPRQHRLPGVYGKLTYTFNDNFLLTGAGYYTDNWLNRVRRRVPIMVIAKYTGTALPTGWNWYVSGELRSYDWARPTSISRVPEPGWFRSAQATRPGTPGSVFTYKALTLDLRYYDTNLTKEECNV